MGSTEITRKRGANSPSLINVRPGIRNVSSITARFSLSNISIKDRLPLLIGILLSGIIIASTWASYRGVKESALELGRQRLQNLTQQLATISQQSAATLLNKTLTGANDPAIRAFLRSPSSTTRPRAVAILQQFRVDADPNSLQVELWSADSKLALVVPEDSAPEQGNIEVDLRQCSGDPFKAMGVMRMVKDIVAYPALATAKDDSGKPIGCVVRWRRVSMTPDAQKRLTDLLGSQAALFFGNSRGDIWTDMSKVVSKPPTGLESTLDITHYQRDGVSVMALGRPIIGTPWFVMVEFPEQLLLNQASGFLRRMTVIGFILLAIGMAGSLWLSRSITRPLHSLTQAASAISGGDYSQRVDIRQKDELGKLARAFNSMVGKVQHSQRELERKARERQLAEEKNRELAAIIKSSKDSIISNSPEGIITSWNDGARMMYGYTPQEAIGQSISLLIPSDLDVEVAPVLERIQRGEGIDDYETERITKEGKRIFVSLTVSPIKDSSGRTSGASTIARDITQRRLAEHVLEETNHKLEETLTQLSAMTQQLWQASKLATMGELAASIAHELNNPLAIVSLRAESVLQLLAVDDPKRRGIEVIAQEVERMAKLVSDLLLFSRRSHRQLSTIDLSLELESSLEFIQYHLRSHKITVITDFASNLPSVQADRQQLRQVFLNLLTNAIDAMPEGGTIRAHTLPCLHENEAAVSIEISDTGNGIKEEDLPKLWEAFFTTKAEGKGTGLGLPICRRMVEEHRGTISIWSAPGEGTTVRILLPATVKGVRSEVSDIPDAVEYEPAN